MKIGFSLGRCVRDIVKGSVNIDDVLVIIARTRINHIELLNRVINEYMYRSDYLNGLDTASCQAIASELWESGKIHQPLLHGGRVHRIAEEYIWMDVIPTATDMDPSVQEAWEAYRMLLVMRGNAIPDPSCR